MSLSICENELYVYCVRCGVTWLLAANWCARSSLEKLSRSFFISISRGNYCIAAWSRALCVAQFVVCSSTGLLSPYYFFSLAVYLRSHQINLQRHNKFSTSDDDTRKWKKNNSENPNGKPKTQSWTKWNRIVKMKTCRRRPNKLFAAPIRTKMLRRIPNQKCTFRTGVWAMRVKEMLWNYDVNSIALKTHLENESAQNVHTLAMWHETTQN